MVGGVACELPGMPEPYVLARHVAAGETVITRGPYVIARYETADIGMRNVHVVSLTEAGHSGIEVAACLGLSAVYVSMLRGRARNEGSAGLLRKRGRNPKLSAGEVGRARVWSRAGVSNVKIGERLGVHPGTVGRALGRSTPAPTAVQDALDGTGEEAVIPDNDAAATLEPGPDAVPAPAPAAEVAGEVRVAAVGERSSRYAGAMLLHPFLEAFGAAGVFAAAGGGRSARYGDVGVLTAATFGFALGARTVEGMKHLARADAGALVGFSMIPELRTLRPRLGVIADGTDPLALQRVFAKALVGADERAQQVFFVDDHFVAYSGARPLAKGWNTKRRHAQRGQDDTFIVDLSGRAICFASGEPSGLSKTMPGVLTQLRAVCGPQARLLLGFDRGGSYPGCFTKLRDAGTDWVTYRRGPLTEPAVPPRWSWFNLDGRRHTYRIADETIELDDYGPARQLSVYEHHKLVFQILTSDTTATTARLTHLLRCRWRIENAFKYLTEHHGIDTLCDYTMTIAPDTSERKNPARTAATATLRTAEAALADAERARGKALAAPGADHPATTIRHLRDQIVYTQDDVTAAKQALKGIPANLPANQIDPTARRATPRSGRRHLQMVLRLLAYNAEHELARRLNTYLADPDEYRAITRNLLHQNGRIDYQPDTITVTINRPDQPRIARALTHLTNELNATKPHMLNDPRPINYQIATT